MKRKFILSFLAVLLVSSTLLVPISFASNDEGNEREIQPYAIPYTVNKPIYDVSYIPNAKIGEILEQRRKASGWFAIANLILPAIKLSGVGVANSVGLALESMGETGLERAYRNGQNVYVAILNANGTPSSLTKQAVFVPSTSPIIFEYRP